MPLNKTFTYQKQLASFCKTGEQINIPGTSKHVQYYRKLIFNNIYDSLSSAYPITKKLLGKNKWVKLVNRFFSTEKITTPQLWYMPKEFKFYTIKNEKKLQIKYPFLADLLTFEWEEIEVFMMPDIPKKIINTPHLYFVNPETKLLKVSYPVHLKKAETISEKDKGIYFIAIHRNPVDGNVEFSNLSIPFVDLLEQLLQNPKTEEELLIILQKYVSLEEAIIGLKKFTTITLHNQLLFKS